MRGRRSPPPRPMLPPPPRLPAGAGDAHFAHGMCKACYLEFIQVGRWMNWSGGGETEPGLMGEGGRWRLEGKPGRVSWPAGRQERRWRN